MLREYLASESVRRQLQQTGMDSFAALWSLEADWVEAPNQERRGWSGVCRLALNRSGGISTAAYLKRQENHGYRSIGNPFRYQPTAYREFKRLKAMQAAGIRVPEVLYYGERRNGRSLQAQLLTREVPRSISLETYLGQAAQRPPVEVRQLIRDTAALVGRLHRCRFQHCALYGKHVLIRDFKRDAAGPSDSSARPLPVLIDVEKARRRPLRLGMALKDLSQFYRRTPWSRAQWDAFLGDYVVACGIPRSQPLLARLIAHRLRRKSAPRRSG